MRTDFTSEIDGALATRNLGARHYSQIARSGNGNMLSDLAEDDLADYDELDGVGESFEELSGAESAELAGLGALGFSFKKLVKGASPRGVFKPFRPVKPGENLPFPAKPGMLWMRKRIPLPQVKPGGGVIARVKWVQMSNRRLKEAAQAGQVQGLGEGLFTSGNVMVSAGIGLGLGLAVWFMLRRRKA